MFLKDLRCEKQWIDAKTKRSNNIFFIIKRVSNQYSFKNTVIFLRNNLKL